MNEWFRKFASKSSEIVGSPWAFLIALLLTVTWGVSGPFFGFSDTWQLVINTASTISTGLIVFLIQNSQNRDAKAIQLKLDELLRAVGEARTGMVDLEDMSDEDLKRLQEEFKRMHERYGDELENGVEVVEKELEDRESKAANDRQRNG